jgi:hypothetical protein
MVKLSINVNTQFLTDFHLLTILLTKKQNILIKIKML